jgi:hypothetical protein
MAKESKEFINSIEVIPIHTERYNRQIARLLAFEDYTKEDLRKGIDKAEYYKAREQKIRAYSDAINTMIQKERILQFHNSGFQLEVIEEKVEIRKSKDALDFDKLTVEELVKLLNLIQKTKSDTKYLAPIILNNSISRIEQVQEKRELNEPVNIELIKHEDPPENMDMSLPFKIDPVIKLKENLNKIAANRFKEVGGNLDKEEERLIQQ